MGFGWDGWMEPGERKADGDDGLALICDIHGFFRDTRHGWNTQGSKYPISGCLSLLIPLLLLVVVVGVVVAPCSAEVHHRGFRSSFGFGLDRHIALA